MGVITPLASGLPGELLTLATWLRPLLERALPRDRGLDAVAVSPGSPQEDEIPMASLQPLSAYHAFYLPGASRSGWSGPSSPRTPPGGSAPWSVSWPGWPGTRGEAADPEEPGPLPAGAAAGGPVARSPLRPHPPQPLPGLPLLGPLLRIDDRSAGAPAPRGTSTSAASSSASIPASWTGSWRTRPASAERFAEIRFEDLEARPMEQLRAHPPAAGASRRARGGPGVPGVGRRLRQEPLPAGAAGPGAGGPPLGALRPEVGLPGAARGGLAAPGLCHNPDFLPLPAEEPILGSGPNAHALQGLAVPPDPGAGGGVRHPSPSST